MVSHLCFHLNVIFDENSYANGPKRQK